MRFGLALISFVNAPERAAIVTRSLDSLAKTDVSKLDHRPLLDISFGPGSFDYERHRPCLENKFYVRILPDPPDVPKPDVMHLSATAAAMRLLAHHTDVTHVVCMVDDYVYNPQWLHQLRELILRHPANTRAWSVYRSRYTAFHRIIDTDGVDDLMSMHDSIGCVTRNEMLEFCSHGYVPAPDISHASRRPGNRWATKVDYIENIARHHDRGIGHVDCAIDFVGE